MVVGGGLQGWGGCSRVALDPFWIHCRPQVFLLGDGMTNYRALHAWLVYKGGVWGIVLQTGQEEAKHNTCSGLLLAASALLAED